MPVWRQQEGMGPSRETVAYQPANHTVPSCLERTVPNFTVSALPSVALKSTDDSHDHDGWQHERWQTRCEKAQSRSAGRSYPID